MFLLRPLMTIQYSVHWILRTRPQIYMARISNSDSSRGKGGGPGVVATAACLESRISRVRAPPPPPSYGL